MCSSFTKMSNYPNLRENIENNIISYIYNNGPEYKKNILLLIGMEHAYMNINHDEFMKNLYVPFLLYILIHIGPCSY